MNKVNDVRGRCLLFGLRLELEVNCILILVVSHNRCHGTVGVDADEAVALPVLDLIDALVDKLNLHESTVQCAGGGVIALSTKLA